LGYVDSSNLYAFAGGDPVNGRDPSGEKSFGQWIHELSEDAFTSGNPLAIAGAVVGETIYAATQVGSVGAVGKIDAAQEALDRGEITQQQYWKKTGVAVTQTAASYVGGGVAAKAGALAVRGLTNRVVTGAVAGGAGGASGLLASDAVGVAAGTQQELSSWESYAAATAVGGAFGAASGLKATTRGEVGSYGERRAASMLTRRGYTDPQGVQNNSGHGIDLAPVNPRGVRRFVEVKTSKGGRTPALSRAQAAGADSFVTSRLQRAAGGARGWQNVDAAVSSRARMLLRDVRIAGCARGCVIEITNAGQLSEKITVKPWTGN
jgi:hypothetical protein